MLIEPVSRTQNTLRGKCRVTFYCSRCKKIHAYMDVCDTVMINGNRQCTPFSHYIELAKEKRKCQEKNK